MQYFFLGSRQWHSSQGETGMFPPTCVEIKIIPFKSLQTMKFFIM